jgi:hypothetical protein
MSAAKTRICHHCKEEIPVGAKHDCWTTTVENATRDLPEDLMDAWERIRETALEFGGQRIYASHSSIMFARTTCYFFVRPRKASLQIWFFLGRKVKDKRIQTIVAASKVKYAHKVQVKHRDEVEAPITDWLKEAYDVSEKLRGASRKGGRSAKRKRDSAQP